jgi:hypothetical protein
MALLDRIRTFFLNLIGVQIQLLAFSVIIIIYAVSAEIKKEELKIIWNNAGINFLFNTKLIVSNVSTLEHCCRAEKF